MVINPLKRSRNPNSEVNKTEAEEEEEICMSPQGKPKSVLLLEGKRHGKAWQIATVSR